VTLSSLVRDLETERQALRDATQHMSAELVERRPASDRWSVAEILEHLAIVEKQVAMGLAQKIAGGTALAPLASDDVGPIAFDASRARDRGGRFKTGPASEPKGLGIAGAWTALDDSRRVLRDLIDRHGMSALHQVVLRHPLFGELNAYEWLAFVAAHDARHRAQILDTIETLRSNDR